MAGFSAEDHAWMAHALRLAERGLHTTTPNPRVGCVLVNGGEQVGQGWHQRAGEAHAEVHALRAAGERARGATAYVTLEPCAHHGRTPPCVDALVAAGVRRVVAAIEDPNPEVSGRGLSRLTAAGIINECGLLADEARELNCGFVARMARGRPWLRVKAAASLDGRTALGNGRSQWITDEAARADGQRWRARSCAILAGIGTILDDDPLLNVRLDNASRQPLKVIVDSRLNTPPEARILKSGKTLIVCSEFDAARAARLTGPSAEVIALPDDAGRVDLWALMHELALRGINEVLSEAGFMLNGALIRAGCADELLLYVAPTLLGPDARGLFALPALENLADAQRWCFRDVRQIGSNLRVLLRPST